MTKTAKRTKSPSASKQGDWKGIAPKRWQSRKAKRQKEVIGFQMVSVKMRPAEAEAFDVLCKQIGVTKNNALRSMARDVCGFLEVDAETLAEVRTMSRQLTGIATNINQIAKAGNATGAPDYRAFIAERNQLTPQLIAVQSHLQDVLDLGGRRMDGLAKLQQSVNAS